MKKVLLTSDQQVEADLIIEVCENWTIKIIKDRKGIADSGVLSKGVHVLKTIIIVK